MERQRERARAASRFAAAAGGRLQRSARPSSTATSTLAPRRQRRRALQGRHAGRRDRTPARTAVVVLDRTPFYAESGGQVGDRGELVARRRHLHRRGHAEDPGRSLRPQGAAARPGGCASATRCSAQVDTVARARAAWNHSATHLMHAALRKVLGHARAAERLARRRAAHALRLLAQRADDRASRSARSRRS